VRQAESDAIWNWNWTAVGTNVADLSSCLYATGGEVVDQFRATEHPGALSNAAARPLDFDRA
jgi:hypothetical protein